MRVAVVPGPPGVGQGGLLRELDEAGVPTSDPIEVPDLAAAVQKYEQAGGVRWVWSSAIGLYPQLLRARVRVTRCHDVALTDALLTARDEALRPAVAGTALAASDEALSPTSADTSPTVPNEPPSPTQADISPTTRGGALRLAGRVAAEAAGGGRTAAEVADADRAILRAADAQRVAWANANANAGQRTIQDALFESSELTSSMPLRAPEAGHASAELTEQLEALIAVHADQLRRIAADEHPKRFALMVAADSAGALTAAEMTLAGLPWRADVHDALLTEMLGPRPPAAVAGRGASAQPLRPAKLAVLASQIADAFSSRRPVNPDSPTQLLKALAAEGVRVPSTRLAVLKDVDHPAIPPLLEYKELSRLHSAFGWSWLDTWITDGRFRPEYVVAGVVSGRWASRGGGALQIPRLLRRAVVADPGWVFVVADAAQLEPRVLAALAGDRAFAAAAATGDLYTELAGAFGGDRAKAKIAMLSAMYGGAGGEAGQLLAVLRQRFPAASAYVEAAARAGEEGRVVRSVLGRTCPPPSARWRELTEEAADPDAERDPSAGLASRARGRFTRNFVVQASAADWAAVMLANLRAGLTKIAGDPPQSPEPGRALAGDHNTAGPATPPGQRLGANDAVADRASELVFFQHDEVIVHCQEHLADAVVAAATKAANDAARQVFGVTQVVFPLTTAVVTCYGDAK
ncbi:MAG TPA: bifunctional 3'-5' exonuclease/DNA polymerase [Streptosporangiaceae bacterium]|nr:bifunctional 3'-5' exonuclease/DNA polymerase [Streptosporangiaceae bacterium]